MNKVIPAGIGIGIALIALAVMLSVSRRNGSRCKTNLQRGVQLSDESSSCMAEETKSYDVEISEGLEVGDENP